MASSYPVSLDVFAPTPSTLAGPMAHSLLHKQATDALAAIEAELGVNPSQRMFIRCTSTTRPASPVAGMTIFETDTNRVMQYQSAVTGWTGLWYTAWGRVASVSGNAASGVATLIADTGYACTWVAVANRRYRVWFHAVALGTVAGDLLTTFLSTAANVVVAETDAQIGSALLGMFDLNYELVGVAAGSVTYKMRMQRSAGTGNVSVVASATNTAGMCVEDIGPNGNPL